MEYSAPEVLTSYTVMDLYGTGLGFVSAYDDGSGPCTTDGNGSGALDNNCPL